MEDGKMVRNNASTSYDVTDKSITPLVRQCGQAAKWRLVGVRGQAIAPFGCYPAGRAPWVFYNWMLPHTQTRPKVLAGGRDGRPDMPESRYSEALVLVCS